MPSPDADRAIRQNEAILRLLARLAFKEGEVREMVTFKKKGNAPQKYVEGYNACDGSKTVKQLASIIGVQPQTLSPILQEWEESGIIYRYGETSEGVFYKKVIGIPNARARSTS